MGHEYILAFAHAREYRVGMVMGGRRGSLRPSAGETRSCEPLERLCKAPSPSHHHTAPHPQTLIANTAQHLRSPAPPLLSPQHRFPRTWPGSPPESPACRARPPLRCAPAPPAHIACSAAQHAQRTVRCVCWLPCSGPWSPPCCSARLLRTAHAAQHSTACTARAAGACGSPSNSKNTTASPQKHMKLGPSARKKLSSPPATAPPE